MKVVILGANGLLGHKVLEVLSRNSELDVYGTVRDFDNEVTNYLYEYQIITNVDLRNIQLILGITKPDVIINCIGIIKQDTKASSIDFINSNVVLPQILSKYVVDNNIKLIHISTDCVFSGNVGCKSPIGQSRNRERKILFVHR